jgi:3-hydroxyacyl-CoA dehydrogenase/enoyl-CoA hydratase/3-hydroxybutyryl-CoA epimerase
VFGTFTNEGIAMLGEGVSAAMIENQAPGRHAGGPAGDQRRSLAEPDEPHPRADRKDLEAEAKPLPQHRRSPSST